MTTPHHQPNIPQQTGPARRRWTWILAAAVAVLAIAGGATYALAGGGVGKDSGVEACERAADRAAKGQTADDSDDGDVQMLKDSKHADLREVGAAIEDATDGDLADAMQVGVQMMAACARHGVVIDPTS